MRSLGESGAVAALMRCGEGEAAVGAGSSKRESRAWRGGRMSNVEGEGRAIPPGVGAAEGIFDYGICLMGERPTDEFGCRVC